MFLQGEQLERYRAQIISLHRQAFHEEIKSASFFAVLDNEKLAAVAALKNLYGNWYLRGCVVKPKYRGRGFQRKLIQERLNYLEENGARIARVSVLPDNAHSLNNLIAEGFEYEKVKTIRGNLYHVYKRDLDPTK